MKLKDIGTVGRADGRNEANEKWFMDLFYDGNRNVEQVLENKGKFIISGRKGTGKTILAKYIEKKKRYEGTLTKVFSKEDLFLQYILEKENEPLTETETGTFLVYSILVAITKLIIENQKNIFSSLSVIDRLKMLIAIHRLRKFYFDVYPQGAFKSTSAEDTYADECSLSINKGAKYAAKNQTSKKSLLVRKRYYELEDELKKLVFNVMHYRDVMIFFDDLDELGDSGITDNVTSSIFMKLIEATRVLNQEMLANGIEDSRVIILLRTDIIDSLHAMSSNSNKFAVDSTVNLHWIKSVAKDHRHVLMDLVLTKIRKKCNIDSSVTNEQLYRKLFTGFSDQEPVEYLLRQSFGRPRDVINYLNILIEQFGESEQFTFAMFSDKECRRLYSTELECELKNELSIHFSKEEIDELFELFRSFGRNNFYFETIQQYVIERQENYLHIRTLKPYFIMLYKLGAIGNCWKAGEKNKYAWAYREDTESVDIDFNKKICVHFGLRRAMVG